MRSSHKTRLSVITTATVGVVLAIIFGLILVGARYSALSQKREELYQALRLPAQEENVERELLELHDSRPYITAALFDPTERSSNVIGPLPITPVIGFHKVGHLLMYGEEIRGQTMVAGTSWEDDERSLERLALVLGLLWLPMTLMVGGITWFAANSVFRPLEVLSAQAAAISGSNLKVRLDSQDRAEFGAFAEQLNGMLERIQVTLEREEQFSSDAAHELRTPLAILRTRIETTLLRERTTAEYVASNKAMLGEIDRLTLIVESLLRTSRTPDTDATFLNLEPVVKESVERWKLLSDSKNVTIQADTQPATAALLADELRVILDNGFDNALRFSPNGSQIQLSLRTTANGTELSITDEGPGIPEGFENKVFDRFVRIDDDRNRSSGGAGIGLAVCKRLVEARQGTIQLTNHPNGGAVFSVWLPGGQST